MVPETIRSAISKKLVLPRLKSGTSLEKLTSENKDSLCLLSTYYIPGTLLGSLYICYLIRPLKKSFLINKKTGAQKNK